MKGNGRPGQPQFSPKKLKNPIFQKVVRQGFDFASKTHTAPFGCSDTFGLPATDILPFVLSHKGKHLQNKIGNKGTEQVFVAPGV